MSVANTPRLIESWLPINEISIEAVREGGALAGHPPVNQLHVWWARRPLVVSRATIAAALLDADADRAEFVRAIGSTDTVVAERRKMDEIKASGQWSNVAFSNKRAFTHNLTDTERQWFRDHLAVPDPVILDVTAGGGSIPFEAGRLGLPSIANELNPVAALILRATCQWPQQYGPALVDEYRQVSARFLARVRQLVRENDVYPPEPGQISDSEYVMSSQNCAAGTVRLHKYVWAYLWSRTVHCPDCHREIPLSPNWRLDSSGKGIRLHPDPARGICDFEVVNTTARQSKGTINKGKAACPYPGCGATTPAGYIDQQAQADRLGHRLYCIIVKNQWQKADGQGGWQDCRKPKDQKHIPNREFRVVTPQDHNTGHINALLDANRQQLDAANILPNEPVPPVGDKVVTLHQYGMGNWRDVFNPRQQLVHGYCVQEFQQLVDADRINEEMTPLRTAAYVLVGIAFDKVVNRNCLRSVWDPGTNKVAHSFAQHDFGFRWSYAEMAVAIRSLGLEWALDEMQECIEKLVEMAGYTEKNDQTHQRLAGIEIGNNRLTAAPSNVINGDARMLDLDDDSVGAIVFDPPYHNNVNYAELSDFFYVWLKRTAGYVLGDGLFAQHLTDKVNEAIASPARFKEKAEAANSGIKSQSKARVTAGQLATDDYEEKMDGIFRECHRVIKKDDGIMVVMFTHKSNAAWNAMTIGLIQAGFNITRAWPVKTEAESSLNIRDKAAARSTILLVCRPAGARTPKPWHIVAQEIAQAVKADVANLQNYGLRPVDIYTASFGTALKIVSENWGAKRNTANPDRPNDPFGVQPEDALAVARQEVINFRAEDITNGQQENLSDPCTRFYLLVQDGAGSATIPFDEANLFARVIGLDLAGDQAKRIMENKNAKVTLKTAADRWKERIISAERPAVNPLDQIHTAIAIAAQQDAEAAKKWLDFNGHSWQDGEFKTAFTALRKTHHPEHSDDPGAKALGTLLYGAEQPKEEPFPQIKHFLMQ